MATISSEQVLYNIDAAVPPRGGPPKVKGAALNGVLHELHALATSPPTTYEEVIHFPGQPLFQDTVFEPSYLLAVAASAGVAGLEVRVGDPAAGADFQAVPTTGALPQPLALPVGPLTYRLTFADASVRYAAIKQVIQIQ